MRTQIELERLYEALPKPSNPDGHVRQHGRVRLVVLRKGDGVHETPDAAELTPDVGIVGDRWADGEAPETGRQVTLMNVEVARLVADGLPLHLPGDNFLVDLDLSEDALPVGTLLRAGTAVLRISEEPHRGCKKFAQRFGKDAMRWLNAKHRWPLRLRGVNCSVVGAGRIAIGDAIEVIDAAKG